MMTTVYRTAAYQNLRTESSNVIPIRSTNTRNGKFVRISQNDSDWMKEVENRFNVVTSLPVGWDGYQGRPVLFSVARFAATLIESLYVEGVPPPQVVPGSDGTVQFEWHLNGQDLEVDVLAPYAVVVRREIEAKDIYEEFDLTTDFTDLAQRVEALSCDTDEGDELEQCA